MANKAIKYRCPECLESVAVTPMNKYRKHPPGSDEPCRMSGQAVPVRIQLQGADKGDDAPVKGRDYDECPLCSRTPRLDADGAFKEHAVAKGSEDICGFSGRLANGKRPGTIPGATEYVKEMAGASERKCSGGPLTHNNGCDCFITRIPCPDEKCGRTVGVYDSGFIGPHMQKEWGQTVCTMSMSPAPALGTSEPQSSADSAADAPSTEPLFPTEVFKNGEATPQQPRRVETLALPSATAAPSSSHTGNGTNPSAHPLPEIQALAQAFPRNARIPDSTETADAPPAPVAAPEMSRAASEALDAWKQGAETIREAASLDARDPATTPSAWNPPPEITHKVIQGAEPPIPWGALEFERCSCGQPAGAVHTDGVCVLTFRETHRTCESCGDLLRGYHKCDGKPKGYRDMFSAAGGEPEKHDSSPFVAAGEIPAPLKPLPMDEMSAQLVARMKEIFYAYSNRLDRSVQETLGPSEIGTPCDRRLAMSIMGVPKTNPGGDNWASFVGTCIHAGLAEMFEWADAGQGRFAVEQRVEFPNALVPKGTADLLDRVLLMVDDHKAMGRWSLDKLRLEGIKPLYLVQLMLYAKGLILKGEKVKFVALIGWPREQGNLNDLTAVVLPYDATIADQAFARVDGIAAEIQQRQQTTGLTPLRIARSFDVADDCTYCPFFAKGDAEMERGCNGRR